MKEDENVIYQVYGRTEYAQPLAFIEAVTVARGDLPAVPAGRDWVEVVAFPETAVIQVIPRPQEKTL